GDRRQRKTGQSVAPARPARSGGPAYDAWYGPQPRPTQDCGATPTPPRLQPRPPSCDRPRRLQRESEWSGRTRRPSEPPHPNLANSAGGNLYQLDQPACQRSSNQPPPPASKTVRLGEMPLHDRLL